MNKLLAFLFTVSIAQITIAQQTDVSFKIKGLRAPFVMVGYFQGGKAYRLDSVQVDTSLGAFRLQQNSLSPGAYFCSIANGKLFDFLLPHPTDTFLIEADMARLDSLWSSNSIENEAFFRFEQQRKLLEGMFEAKKSMRTMIAKATKNDPEALKPVEIELDNLLRQTDSLTLDYIAKNPQHLYARMLQAVRPPEPPTSLQPTLKNGKPNSVFSRWQRQHYWDQTDFKDESLLRNSFWHVYFDNFFSRNVVAQPDSMITAVDEVIAKTPHGGAFFRFIVLRITQFYEQNDAPGADRIFVHMVDKFLKKQETPWLDQATLERLAYKADVHRPNLTGSMAVNFTMPDETGQLVELYAIEAPYTILIFYSPLCNHCMEVMPKIYQTYLDYQVKGVKAIAINTDAETQYWKKFVGQQNWAWYDVSDPKIMEQLDKQYAPSNLPVIYLLDKNKKILAKRVKPNELGEYLRI